MESRPTTSTDSAGIFVLGPTFAALLMGLIVMASITLPTTDARSQSFCSDYTIVQGDTLSIIARRLGTPSAFRSLYNANRDVLVSPDVVEIGQVIRIPCRDGSLPAAAASNPALPDIQAATVRPVIEPPQTPVAPRRTIVTRAAPARVPDRPIRFLTGSGYAPFTDEDLPEGGLFTEIVKRSMELGDPEAEFRVIFVNDWDAHLEDLLPLRAFDMGFPWFLPDCSKIDLLSPPNAMRCTDYAASRPFYDAAIAYYSLNSGRYANARTYQEIHGARLCRPEGWFSFDLEGLGLIEPVITLVVAPDQAGCWKMLRTGQVDIVTYDALPAEEEISELGIAGEVKELDALTTNETLHVFVPKDHPNRDVFLATLNSGFEKLLQSGEWFQIVQRQISETFSN